MLKVIQEMINVPILIQFITTYVSQNAFGYFICYAASTMAQMKTVKSCAQLVAITVETLLPCLYGERLKDVCDELAQAIYGVKWYEQDVRFCRHLLLFLVRVDKEEYVLAGNYIPVNIETFVKVVFNYLLYFFLIKYYILSESKVRLLFYNHP